MPIPTQADMFGVVLEHMQDGVPHSRKEIKDLIRESLKLTPAECSYKTGSGAPVYESRIGWGISYLARAKYLDRVSRGVYIINEDGKRLYGTGMKGAELLQHLQATIAEKNPWNVGADSEKKPEVTASESEQSPTEVIDSVMEELNSSLASDLLDNLLSHDAAFFEKVVVDLLEKMGYGRGRVTKLTNDGGIDGVITTDALGFDPIYTQAKRYAPENRVGRPEVQAFAGALGSVTRGAFITTSSFQPTAIEYAAGYPHATIVLIDGMKLAELMIKYNLGVTVEKTHEIKRIDIDYFEGE